MANGAGRAVSQATRLQEIGFAEFTSTLVNDVFEALIAAHLRQTQAYIDLVKAAAVGLRDFIAQTQGAIGPQEVAAFLDRFTLQVGQPVGDPNALNDALELPAEAGEAQNNRVATAANLTATTKQRIEEAAARRLAANRFELLQETVRQGAMRLVVDNGVVETRLTFTTFGQSSRTRSTSERQVAAEGGAGAVGGAFGFFAGVGGAALGGSRVGADARLTVSTANRSDRDVTGSRVQIFGRVEIRFKTDYAPLSPR